MRSQGSGTIINISSVLGKAYNPLYGWYVSSKHALEGWSDVLRLEVKQFGIDVVIIEPGMIKTNIGNHRKAMEIIEKAKEINKKTKILFYL